MGRLVLRSNRNIVRSGCGQVSGGPSGVVSQSCARISAPISPPAARKLGHTGDSFCFVCPIYFTFELLSSMRIQRKSVVRDPTRSPYGDRLIFRATRVHGAQLIHFRRSNRSTDKFDSGAPWHHCGHESSPMPHLWRLGWLVDTAAKRLRHASYSGCDL